jgi:hypothetical protein
MSMLEDSVNPPVPFVDGRHMGPEARLALRAQRGAEKIKAMGHSGSITLESFLLAQGRMNSKLQKQINHLTGHLKAADAMVAKKNAQLAKANLYIADLKQKVRDLNDAVARL